MINQPKIIKTKFYVDKDRNYQFDVNQNITISDIKNMLVVASKIAKIGLRIYLKENLVEYTKYKDETLEQLFPAKDEIEFVIKIDRRFKNNQDYDQLKLGAYCEKHRHKYCFYYCFSCEESLCSLCLSNGGHNYHQLFEKFDYLKPSNEIVDIAFSDLDEIVKKVNSFNLSDVDEYRKKLQFDYFPSLIDVLKQIESKLISQIEEFNRHFNKNIVTFKANKQNLIEHCTDGIDELKVKLEIDNLLKDEGVFLHFDHKIKELETEKVKIYDDKTKIETILKSFSYLKARIEGIYLELKNFLNSHLYSKVYDDLRDKTNEINIEDIRKDEIFNRLLNEFDPLLQTAKRRETMLNINSHQQVDSSQFNLNPFIGNSLNQVGGHRFIDEKQENHNRYSHGNNKNSNNKASHMNNSHDSHDHHDIYSNKHNQEDASNTYRDISGNKQKSQNDSFISLSNTKERTSDQSSNDQLQSIINKNPSSIKKEASNNKSLYKNLSEQDDKVFLIDYKVNSNEICIYDNKSNNIFISNIHFNKAIHGIDSFLSSSGKVNTSKGIYISGGLDALNKESNLFFFLNPVTNELLRYHNLLSAKHNHSLIYYNGFIYSVGGFDSNTAEKYDIKENKWVSLPNMLISERQKPMLYIKDSWLYAFFGYDQNGFISSIERINIKSVKSRWENVLYSNPSKLDLNFYGAGIINSGSHIFFLGGKSKDSTLNSILLFNFENNTFEVNESLSLNDYCYFDESMFVSIDNDQYILMNKENDEILNINFNSE